MTFEEIKATPVLDAPCTIVVVKNESYLKSLQLLRDDVKAEGLRVIYFPVENPDLFSSHPESDVAVYWPSMLEDPEGFSYGGALLNAPRMRPDIIITEHTENNRAHRSGPLFGEHIDRNTPMTEENSTYLVDSMIRFSCAGGLFAIAVESETVEESIRNLFNNVQEDVHNILFNNPKIAYMDGKRWEVTPENVLQALLD